MLGMKFAVLFLLFVRTVGLFYCENDNEIGLTDNTVCGNLYNTQ
jgi:hypothetical protein